MSDEYTGYTASFRPGGRDYDSPLVVVRGSTEAELLERLGVDASDPDGPCELGTAVASFHDKLRRQFEDVVGVASPGAVPAPGFSSAPAPIWQAAVPSGGALTPNADGTYPPCPHGTRPRKPWTSPRNSKVYLFCALDKGAAGACQTVTL